MMTYPVVFRKKVLGVKEKESLSFAGVAQRFGLSKAAVFRWSKDINPKACRHRKWSKIDRVALEEDIKKYPDSYCYERAKRLKVSTTGIRDAQYRLGVSYKKNSQTSQGMSRKALYVLPRA